jgi:hypothetical protein
MFIDMCCYLSIVYRALFVSPRALTTIRGFGQNTYVKITTRPGIKLCLMSWFSQQIEDRQVDLLMFDVYCLGPMSTGIICTHNKGTYNQRSYVQLLQVVVLDHVTSPIIRIT